MRTMTADSDGRQVLRWTSATTAAAAVGCVAVAGIAAGTAGMVAAGAAAVVVVVFFATGVTPLKLVRADRSTSPLAMPLALAGYLVRIVALASVAFALTRRPDFDRAIFGATILVCSLAWPAAATLAVLRRARTSRARPEVRRKAS